MSCFNQVILRNVRNHKCVNLCTFGRNYSTLVEEASHWKPEAHHWELCNTLGNSLVLIGWELFLCYFPCSSQSHWILRETSPKSDVQISVLLFKTNIVPSLLSVQFMINWIDIKMFLNVFTFFFTVEAKKDNNKILAMNLIHPEHFSVNSGTYTIVKKFISSSNVA